MTNAVTIERKFHKGWIGVDLDGTLAYYDKWQSWDWIGPPIPRMVERVRAWLAEGREVRIFTARVGGFNHKTFVGEGDGTQRCRVKNEVFTRADIEKLIGDWTEKHIGTRLAVTCEKDVEMIELWDDRCVQVIKNTGRTLHEADESEWEALRGAP